MADQADRKIPASDIPVSLGKPSLRRRLEAYYSLVNPESIKCPSKWLSTFDQIYEKYGGTHEGERKLQAKLAKKYGATVRLLLAESAMKKTFPTGDATIPNEEKTREESWFELRPSERESGIIDFTSDKFDPWAALRDPQEEVQKKNPWISECQRLNHTDQFRSYLPPSDPLYRNFKSQKARTPDNQQNKDKESNVKVKNLGPFAAIASNHKKGPLSLLNRLLEKRQRVRLLIRYVNGIRGTLTGYLTAYDKHFNMILRDVDEVYCPRAAIDGDKERNEPSNESFSNLETEIRRRITAVRETKDQPDSPQRKWSIRQRHMKQILVRGDNIVMVYKADDERSAWPMTAKSPLKSVHGRRAVMVSSEKRVGTPGSLIYAYQKRQQPNGTDRNRRQPRENFRADYRSSDKR